VDKAKEVLAAQVAEEEKGPGDGCAEEKEGKKPALTKGD
jgi:hypothetical protein